MDSAPRRSRSLRRLDQSLGGPFGDLSVSRDGKRHTLQGVDLMTCSLSREYEIRPLAGGDSPQFPEQYSFLHPARLLDATGSVYFMRQDVILQVPTFLGITSG